MMQWLEQLNNFWSNLDPAVQAALAPAITSALSALSVALITLVSSIIVAVINGRSRQRETKLQSSLNETVQTNLKVLEHRLDADLEKLKAQLSGTKKATESAQQPAETIVVIAQLVSVTTQHSGQIDNLMSRMRGLEKQLGM